MLCYFLFFKVKSIVPQKFIEQIKIIELYINNQTNENLLSESIIKMIK